MTPNAASPTVDTALVAQRPRPVVIAIALFVGSYLMGLAKALFSAGLPQAVTAWAGLFVALALVAGLAFALWSRQNWARYLTIVLLLIGFASLPLAVAHITHIVDILVFALQGFMQMGVVVLLVQKEARGWFQRRGREDAGVH